MEHLGADADLCAKAKLKAVRKSGRCVDIDAGGVHLIQKCPGMRFVVRDDCFGMSGVVAVDMRDCFFQATDRLYRQLERQIFCSASVAGTQPSISKNARSSAWISTSFSRSA